MASPTKKSKIDSSLPICPYDGRCYRKNPQHFKEFSHPSKDKSSDKGSSDTDTTDGTSQTLSKSTTIDTRKLPPCKYGANCYRKNLLHFAEYWHPTAGSSSGKRQQDSDSGNDTEELESDDDDKDVPTSSTSTKSKNTGIKKEFSMVKSYSKMTEAERKELISKALEAKKKLEEQLEEAKCQMKEKDKKLQKLQDEVSKGVLLVNGEKEALEGKKTIYFPLKAERNFDEGSAEQMHFRLAESQFYRLLSSYATYEINMVEYVVNPELVKKFREAREDLKKHRGEKFSFPVLAFHGTATQNIQPICTTGFKVPGDSGFKHKTDTGYYGKGVYFSEYPSYSISYIAGAQKLLLCQVLPGKVFHCKKLIHGAPLMAGHDSHMSPCGQEIVIFNSHHILPAYIVHYKNRTSGNFKYDTAPATDTKGNDSDSDGSDDDSEDPFDGPKLNKACNAAIGKKKTKVFNGQSILFSGKFILTQKEIADLAVKHGATKGTIGSATMLIVGEDTYSVGSTKLDQAEKKGLPVLVEKYLYDSINKGKLLPQAEYLVE